MTRIERNLRNLGYRTASLFLGSKLMREWDFLAKSAAMPDCTLYFAVYPSHPRQFTLGRLEQFPAGATDKLFYVVEDVLGRRPTEIYQLYPSTKSWHAVGLKELKEFAGK